MATNLTEAVSAARTGNLLSKLKIDNALYNIKDPAVEVLAAAVDTAIANLETELGTATSWDAVSKGSETKKYATAVSQGTDGAITVTYSNLRDTALAKANDAKKFATSVTQDVDGVVSATYDDALSTDVVRTATTSDSTHNGLSSTTVEAALQELDALLKSETGARTQGDADLLGAATDASTATTIYGIKKYTDEQIAALAGEDWSQNAKTVKAIIDELSQDGNANWGTVADKIRGDFTVGEGANATTDIKSYIDAKVSAAESAASGGITDLDAEETSTDGTNVQVKVTEVDGVITAVNVTTDNTINATDLSNKVGDIGNVTVKSYVDTAVANKNVSASSSSTDYITASASNNAVTVAATTKTTDAIAAAETSIQSLTVNNQTATISGNANAKAASVTIYGDQIDLSTSDGTKVTTAIAAKANKAAITSGTINNWSANYTSNDETLAWTNTQTSVYVPVANQTL